MVGRGHMRDWQCLECGACGAAPSEQPLWMVVCDDCGDGPVVWANDELEDQGYSVRSGSDSPLDAPSMISRSDLRTLN